MKKYYYLTALAASCFILTFGMAGALSESTSDSTGQGKPCNTSSELLDGKISHVTISDRDKTEKKVYGIQQYQLTLMSM